MPARWKIQQHYVAVYSLPEIHGREFLCRESSFVADADGVGIQKHAAASRQ